MEEEYLAPRKWMQGQELVPMKIHCGFCGEASVANYGYIHTHIHNRESALQAKIYICPNCGCPLFYDKDEEFHPGPKLGKEIENLPDDVSEVYDEIRDCIKNNCNTAAIMLGRKLIMHLSVNKAEAKANDAFVKHIEHLKSTGYVPPNGYKLLEFIKNLGNQQNHEIVIGDPDEAEKMLKFIEVLLLFMYEVEGYFDETP